MSSTSGVGITALTSSLSLNLSRSQARLQVDVGRLSSGLRIQTAADDPSGLAIAEKLQSKVNGYDQSAANVQSAANALAVADGALATVTDILQRLRTLAVQANNDLLSTGDRTNIAAESNQLQAEINRIAQNTRFNGLALLNAKRYQYALLTVPDALFPTVPPLAAGTGSFTPAGTAWTVAGANGFDHSAIWTVGWVQTNWNVQNIPSGSTQVAGVQGSGQSVAQNINNFVAATTYAVKFNVTQALNGSFAGTVKVLVDGAQVGSFTPVAANPANPNWQSVITNAFLPGAGTHSISFQGASVGSNAWVLFDNVQITAVSGPGAGTAPQIDGSVFSIHAGADEGNTTRVQLPTVFTSNLAISADTVSNSPSAAVYETHIDSALDAINGARATLGAQVVSLQYQAQNSNTAAVNLAASASNIRDANMARTATAFAQERILSSLGASLLARLEPLASSVEKLFN